jgi:hypothetical protein
VAWRFHFHSRFFFSPLRIFPQPPRLSIIGLCFCIVHCWSSRALPSLSFLAHACARDVRSAAHQQIGTHENGSPRFHLSRHTHAGGAGPQQQRARACVHLRRSGGRCPRVRAARAACCDADAGGRPRHFALEVNCSAKACSRSSCRPPARRLLPASAYLFWPAASSSPAATNGTHLAPARAVDADAAPSQAHGRWVYLGCSVTQPAQCQPAPAQLPPADLTVFLFKLEHY